MAAHTTEQGGEKGEFEHKAAGFLNWGPTWLQNGFAAHRWQTPGEQTQTWGKTVDSRRVEAQNPPHSKL